MSRPPGMGYFCYRKVKSKLVNKTEKSQENGNNPLKPVWMCASIRGLGLVVPHISLSLCKNARHKEGVGDS